MISADEALINLINRTTAAYVQNAPQYITYTEWTTAHGAGRSKTINRFVAVRQADDFAVMKDLPDGGTSTGQAFPIIPYFDPLSSWSYSWFANLKNVAITLTRYPPAYWPTPPPQPPGVIGVTYVSFWAPSYTSDSTDRKLHLRVLPTPSLPNTAFYPYDITVDPATGLPSHIEVRFKGNDDAISLDYAVIQNHWVITHGSYTAPQHVGPLSFTVISDIVYKDIAFPQTPPDPRLASPPSPPPTLAPGG